MDVREHGFSRLLTLLSSVLARLFGRRYDTGQHAAGQFSSHYRYPSEPRPTLREFTRVISIGQTQDGDNTAITLLSLEAYADGYLIHGRYRRRWGEPFSLDNIWFFLPIFTAMDDLGGKYTAFPHIDDGSEGRFTHIFSPPLNADAQMLRLEVTRILWSTLGPNTMNKEVEPGRWVFQVPVAASAR